MAWLNPNDEKALALRNGKPVLLLVEHHLLDGGLMPLCGYWARKSQRWEAYDHTGMRTDVSPEPAWVAPIEKTPER